MNVPLVSNVSLPLDILEIQAFKTVYLIIFSSLVKEHAGKIKPFVNGSLLELHSCDVLHLHVLISSLKFHGYHDYDKIMKYCHALLKMDGI